MQTNFKVLTYANQYIDANKLHIGLYSSSIPFIYDKRTTIEKLIKQAKEIQEKIGSFHFNDKYFEMLKQCVLIECTIILQAE